MNDISSRLKQLRLEKKFTQKEIAQSLGITQQAYSNYECGKREIPVCHIRDLAMLYSISADLILDVPVSLEGTVDLNAPYTRHVTLIELIHDLQALNRPNRSVAAYYIHLMRRSQKRESASATASKSNMRKT